MEGYVGEIRLFAGTFAPYGWAFCQGQTLQIRTNTPLYAILGTQYGGNGQTTFQLPNFSGRVAVGSGQGQSLTPYNNGQFAGAQSVTLMQNEMAAHSHGVTVQQSIQGTVTINALSSGADKSDPAGATIAGDGATALFSNGAPVPMSPKSITSTNFSIPAPTVTGVAPAGSSAPHNNMQPYLGLNYIICLNGYFPTRD